MVAFASACAGVGSDADIASVRHSPEPRYWLGEEFERLPVTHADDGLIVYGDCDPGPDSGCAPPLELQHWRLADRHPNEFTSTPGTPAPCVRGRIGGRLVVAFSTTGGLEVYLGHTVVVVFAEWRRALRAAKSLEPLSSSARISPPPPDVRRSVARCADNLSRSPEFGL